MRAREWRSALLLILGVGMCGGLILIGSSVPTSYYTPESPDFASALSSGESGSCDYCRHQVELNSLCLARLAACDGETDIDDVVSIIDKMANDHTSTQTYAPALNRLIDETSRLYSGRDGYETRRLRAYALAKLSRPDTPDFAIPVILELLVNAPDALSRASAARAAGRIGERCKGAVPMLTRLARPGAVPTIVSLDRFSQLDVPVEEWTTERVECVRALGKIGALPAESILVLRSILDEATYEPLSRNLLVAAARTNLDQVEAVGQRPEDSDLHSLAILAGEWSQSTSRPLLLHGSLLFMNQFGSKVDVDSLAGKPIVMAFFYISCTNPERCAKTIDAFRHLRSKLEERRLNKQVRLVLVSLEPVNDTPAALMKYGVSAGLTLDDDMTMLRPIGPSMETMSRLFKLPVSRCCNLVTTHGVPFFVLDQHGRLARRYESVGDDLEPILEDAYRLLRERDARSTTFMRHDQIIIPVENQ
jgi:cytochrome oxidase Cu insertion factor (SCO1/SenC/PrrC family)